MKFPTEITLTVCLEWKTTWGLYYFCQREISQGGFAIFFFGVVCNVTKLIKDGAFPIFIRTSLLIRTMIYLQFIAPLQAAKPFFPLLLTEDQRVRERDFGHVCLVHSSCHTLVLIKT